MNKPKLKTGMRVELDNGGVGVVALNHHSQREVCDAIQYDDGGWDLLDDISDEIVAVLMPSSARTTRVSYKKIWPNPKYKTLTPHEAMIKLIDDGEFECEVADFDGDEWMTRKLVGVSPYQVHPFRVSNGPSWGQCRIKLEDNK